MDDKNPISKYIISYFEKDGFYLFKQKHFRGQIVDSIKNYYKKELFQNTKNVLGLLIEMPFPIIISLNPDDILWRVANERYKSFQFLYFNKNKPAPVPQFPLDQHPLIYNLIGYIHDDSSLVLTYDDFFSYVYSVYKNDGMSPILKESILYSKILIFIGLPYEKWYLQFLLRSLDVHSKDVEFERYSSQINAESNLHILYTEEYKINFNITNVKDFVLNLHRSLKEKNALRKTITNEFFSEERINDRWDYIIDLIVTDRLDDALKYLREALKDKNPLFYNELLLIHSNFNRLMTDFNSGAIDFKEKNRFLVGVTRSLFSLINQIREGNND